MISIKKPYGAIHESWIASLLPPTKDGRFYVIDKFSSTMEVEESVYNNLKEKGVKVYEGRVNQTRVNQL